MEHLETKINGVVESSSLVFYLFISEDNSQDSPDTYAIELK